MAEVRITKKDVIWSYVAQFFNIGSGFITLPLVLHILTADEIGMNYLMMTVSTLVGLLDFGFAPQFARNITYVFAGAHEIKKEGVADTCGNIDYNLLRNMIGVAKMVYSRLAFFSLVLMLTLGTWYIYRVTDGFTNVSNSLLIWIIYSFSVFFNIYFVYYSSLLTGKGLIMEGKKAMIAQRSVYILLTYILLLLGCGLIGVVVSNFLSPFVGRIISYRYFYNKEMKESLSNTEYSKKAQKELFITIWYNAKKLGLVFLGSYAINKFGMFIASLFLTLEEIASYGLMLQLFSIIVSISCTFNYAAQTEFAAFNAEGHRQKELDKFALSMFIYYCLFCFGSLAIIVIGPWALSLIGSNATLPSTLILSLYAIVLLLENNHAMFASVIVSGNKIPFVESSLIAGAMICIGSYLSLKFTTLGILGLVIIQGICQLAYSNWKWPYVVCRDFHISFLEFLKIGAIQTLKYLPLNFYSHKL